MDDYSYVCKTSLKLKDGSISKKKRKQKEKEIKKALETSVQNDAINSSTADEGPKKTKAEESFLRMQEKIRAARILEKANKSHKKRVEEFNAHLDSLSEHYDIPKVSWTK